MSSRDATSRISGSYAPAQRLPFTSDTGMIDSQPIDKPQVTPLETQDRLYKFACQQVVFQSKHVLGERFSVARMKPEVLTRHHPATRHMCNCTPKFLAQLVEYVQKHSWLPLYLPRIRAIRSSTRPIAIVIIVMTAIAPYHFHRGSCRTDWWYGSMLSLANYQSLIL